MGRAESIGKWGEYWLSKREFYSGLRGVSTLRMQSKFGKNSGNLNGPMPEIRADE